MVTFFGICIVLAFVSCFSIFSIQEKLIFYPSKLQPEYKYSFPYSFNEHHVSVKNATINLIHFHTVNPQGAIFYLHGNAGTLADWGHIYKDFHSFHFDFFILDYRGYGKSTGNIENQKQLLDDCEQVYNFALSKNSYRIKVIYGRSIGTGVASYLASKYQPDQLILESPYSSLTSVIQTYYPFVPSFIVKYPLNSVFWLKKVKSQILLVHGKEDTVIPVREAEKIKEQVPLVQLQIIEKGDHNNLNHFSEYHLILKNFLKNTN